VTFERAALILATTTLVAFACEWIRTLIRRRSEPVFDIDPDDSRMREAILRARSNIEVFWEAFAAKREIDTDFALKCRFERWDCVEQIWCAPMERKGGQIKVRLLNIPLYLPLSDGDTVLVTDDQITDWLVVRAGEILGRETQKVLEQMASEEHQAAT
jgi:uncharacterized protein YegJ (DUF2314 family)